MVYAGGAADLRALVSTLVGRRDAQDAAVVLKRLYKLDGDAATRAAEEIIRAGLIRESSVALILRDDEARALPLLTELSRSADPSIRYAAAECGRSESDPMRLASIHR